MSKGFCDHCFSWGEIADHDRNMCTTCKEIEDGRAAMRNDRTNKESMRPLYGRDSGGRGSA